MISPLIAKGIKDGKTDEMKAGMLEDIFVAFMEELTNGTQFPIEINCCRIPKEWRGFIVNAFGSEWNITWETRGEYRDIFALISPVNKDLW